VDLEKCSPRWDAESAAIGRGSSSTPVPGDDMALFWSMRQVDGAPTLFWFPDAPSAVYELRLMMGDSVLQQLIIERQLMADRVTRVPLTLRADSIVGSAYEPSPERPPRRHPAVILLGGSGGGHPMDALAALLASDGYETVSLAYYREAGLPDDLIDIPIESVRRALAWLRARPSVD